MSFAKTLALAVAATVVVGVSAACSSPDAPAAKAPATTAPAAAATQAPQVDTAGRAFVKTALAFDARSILSWDSGQRANDGFDYPADALGLPLAFIVPHPAGASAIPVTAAGCAVIVTYPGGDSRLGVAGEPTCTPEDPATAAAAQAFTKMVLTAAGRSVQDALTGTAWSITGHQPDVGDFAAVLALATTDATNLTVRSSTTDTHPQTLGAVDTPDQPAAWPQGVVVAVGAVHTITLTAAGCHTTVSASPDASLEIPYGLSGFKIAGQNPVFVAYETAIFPSTAPVCG